MKSSEIRKPWREPGPLASPSALLGSIQRTTAATNVVIWDTITRIAKSGDIGARPVGAVPADLTTWKLTREGRVRSGYYGREYSFQGYGGGKSMFDRCVCAARAAVLV
jgi:hypothetical protein